MSQIPEFSLNDDSNDIPTVTCANTYPNDLPLMLNNYKNNAFSLLCYNIRSCRKNFPLFLSFLSTLLFNFSVIVLCESWLSSDIDYGFDIAGYQQLNMYRNDHGGGIKVYCRNELKFDIIDNLSFVNAIMEILTFTLIGPNFKYIICSVYRPPRSSINLFLETFFDDIVGNFDINDKIIIVGDLNINLFNPLNMMSIENFIGNMLAFSFFPIITKHTKYNPDLNISKFSLIDHIWSNFKIGSSHLSGVVEYCQTDHYPIFYTFKQNLDLVCKVIKLRPLSVTSVEEFKSKIQSCSFLDVYSLSDCNDAFECFYNKIFKTYRECFKIKKKRLKTNLINAPWVNKRLKLCIKKKFRLYNEYKRGLISKRDFNMYKKMLVFVTNKMRNLYYVNNFKRCSNIKETWKNINCITNRGVMEHNIEIKHNNMKVPDIELPKYFNDYFTRVPYRLTTNFPANIDFSNFNCLKTILPSFVIWPTNFNEVLSILNSFNNKGNSVYDIRPKLLKEITLKVIPVIVYLFNMCIINGVYPKVLKVARVVPIYKSGDRSIVSNYRPISNLSIFNKIFETLINNRMQSFITKHNIISRSQYGFRKGLSTTLAVFNLVNDILPSFNTKSFTIAIFIDLKKAFDTVDNRILLYKLQKYGFRGICYSFLKSYLSERKQFANVNGRCSLNNDIGIGVPQGSVLGPQLFNIFIDDICNLRPGKCILFADDAVFYVSNENFAECVNMINELIVNLSGWVRNNRLTINVSKTKLMLFSPKHIENLPALYYNGEQIQWVKSIKYLGMLIDNRLSFVPHVEAVHRKLSALHGLFYAVSKLLPKTALMTLYHSLVYPTILQNIILWGGIAACHINRIKIIINKILRCIIGVKFDQNRMPLMPTAQMYKSLKVLNFDDVYKLHLLKFIHQSFYHNHDLLFENFSHLLPNHQYLTRQNRINLPIIRLNIEKHWTIFQCCKIINELDEEFLHPQSTVALKKKFKQRCIDNY